MGNDEEWCPTGFSVRVPIVPHIYKWSGWGTKCKDSKFVNTRVATSVKSNDGCIKFQSDLDRLLEWFDVENEF